MKFLSEQDITEPVTLATAPGQPEQVHLFDEPSINAINAALAVGRPLLLLGEPGTGKSQLARAAAKKLGWAYIQRVVEARTEAQDLLWHLDAVSRLAEAQLAGALGNETIKTVRERLSLSNFVAPGPLWWAINWGSAALQAEKVKAPSPVLLDGGSASEGCVLLIDEIDKGEPEVPNGLLEVLGNGEFTPPGRAEPVRIERTPPLIIITSNEERAMPPAFTRRCLAFRLTLPSDPQELVKTLTKRAKAHFQEVDDKVLLKAADLLIKDRSEVKQGIPSGQAQYLDLIRALVNRAPGDTEKQLAIIGTIAPYVLKTQMAVR